MYVMASISSMAEVYSCKHISVNETKQLLAGLSDQLLDDIVSLKSTILGNATNDRFLGRHGARGKRAGFKVGFGRREGIHRLS
mgnify:CR=1 FL=1